MFLLGRCQHNVAYFHEDLKADESSADTGTETGIDRQLWGMFWLQGESDSSKAKDANAYLSTFNLFIAP